MLDFFAKGGPIMWPLLIIALAAVYFTINRFMAFSQSGSTAPGLTDRVIELVRKGEPGTALKEAETTKGPVASSLAFILKNRNLSLADIERQVEAQGQGYFLKLEQYLPALDTFTTLSPLLGLLGTILGMVKVFQTFSGANTEEGKANVLSGVGESLYATAFGISIAVFCFAVYNYFSARQRSITIETEQAANKLIAEMHQQAGAAAKQ